MQKPFLDSYPALQEALVIGKDVDPTPRTTRKCGKSLSRKIIEEEDILLVPEVLPKRSQKKISFVA